MGLGGLHVIDVNSLDRCVVVEDKNVGARSISASPLPYPTGHRIKINLSSSSKCLYLDVFFKNHSYRLFVSNCGNAEAHDLAGLYCSHLDTANISTTTYNAVFAGSQQHRGSEAMNCWSQAVMQRRERMATPRDACSGVNAYQRCCFSYKTASDTA